MFDLIPFRPDDFSLFASLVFDEAVMGMNLGRVFTRAEAEAFFGVMLALNDAGTVCRYARVHLPESGDFIGMFGVDPGTREKRLRSCA